MHDCAWLTEMVRRAIHAGSEQARVACKAYLRWTLQGPGTLTINTLLLSCCELNSTSKDLLQKVSVEMAKLTLR
jgi:hypothetical protein